MTLLQVQQNEKTDSNENRAGVISSRVCVCDHQGFQKEKSVLGSKSQPQCNFPHVLHCVFI